MKKRGASDVRGACQCVKEIVERFLNRRGQGVSRERRRMILLASYPVGPLLRIEPQSYQEEYPMAGVAPSPFGNAAARGVIVATTKKPM
jgi:hypothetical protein